MLYEIICNKKTNNSVLYFLFAPPKMSFIQSIIFSVLHQSIPLTDISLKTFDAC